MFGAVGIFGVETFVKADIFFFVTTIAVVVITVFLSVALWYAIFAFRRVREICDKVEGRIDMASTQVKELAADVKESFLFKFLFKSKSRNKKSK